MTAPSQRVTLLVLLLAGACAKPDGGRIDTAAARAAVSPAAAESSSAPRDTAFTPSDTMFSARTPAAMAGDAETTKATRPPRSKPTATKTSTIADDPAPGPPAARNTTVVARETAQAVDTPRTPAPVVIAADTPPPEPKPVAADPRPKNDTAVARKLPFAPGERLEYQVKFGAISVGSATLEVMKMDTIRGVPAMHIVMRVKGSLGFVGVDDRYESWFDPRTMSSLRYVQDIDEATYERVRHYEIYPERPSYHEKGKKELPSVRAPLDDASFLFFMRSIPLAIGQTYDFDRYFKPDRNPVRVTVLRREKVKVPAGTYSTLVVRPIIKTTGLFSEGGRAEVWFSDDDTRLLVQLKTQMRIGSLNMFLRKVRLSPEVAEAGR